MAAEKIYRQSLAIIYRYRDSVLHIAKLF